MNSAQKVKSNGLELYRSCLSEQGGVIECTIIEYSNQGVGSTDELKKQSPGFGVIYHAN